MVTRCRSSPRWRRTASNEFLDVVLTTRVAQDRKAAYSSGGTLHVHCTDTDGEWLMSFGDGLVSLERSHGKGDAAVRGTASDLLLLLTNRVGPSAVETFGDAGVLDRFRAVRF
jgi:predicted lipid carrier protein YhbT